MKLRENRHPLQPARPLSGTHVVLLEPTESGYACPCCGAFTLHVRPIGSERVCKFCLRFGHGGGR